MHKQVNQMQTKRVSPYPCHAQPYHWSPMGFLYLSVSSSFQPLVGLETRAGWLSLMWAFCGGIGDLFLLNQWALSVDHPSLWKVFYIDFGVSFLTTLFLSALSHTLPTLMLLNLTHLELSSCWYSPHQLPFSLLHLGFSGICAQGLSIVLGSSFANTLQLFVSKFCQLCLPICNVTTFITSPAPLWPKPSCGSPPAACAPFYVEARESQLICRPACVTSLL